MTTSALNQGSAKIYQFPVGGRAALDSRRDSAASGDKPSGTKAVISSSWYHEAAVLEDRAPKPQ